MADEKKKPKIQISLEQTDPKKEDDVWKTSVTAVISKGTQAQENLGVQFYLEGVNIGSSKTTAADGRATIDLEFKKSGIYFVEAQITDEFLSGLRKSTRVSISTEEKKKKVAAFIACDQIGFGSNYQLLCQVFSDDKSPVAGAMLRVIDQDMVGGHVDVETDKFGNAKCSVVFCPVFGDHKVVIVKVLGTEAETFKTIYRKE